MAVSFTEEQLKVIRLRDRNILVSAAAGSGKTAVLVERILKRLTTDEPPLEADQMLVVTFTEAAAAEMKQRIRDAVEKALAENPDNVHLQRQATLIDRAQITTIHSFCLSVIREHFSSIDLDPGFRIAEEGEMKLLKRDVADELVDSRYEEGTESFLRLSDTFAPGRNDGKLVELVLQVYEFSGSHPDPKEWLLKCAKVYENPEEGGFLSRILQEVEHTAADMTKLLQYALKICREEDGPFPYEEAVLSDLNQITRLNGVKNYQKAWDVLRGLTWMRLSAKKAPEVSEEKKNTVKAVRDMVKDMAAGLTEQYFYCTYEEAVADMRFMYPVMQEFVRLVMDFSEAFTREKRTKNLIDFRDMEHLALQILAKKENGVFVPTEAAKEYQERFEEIMIDEYQDSNLIQETLLTSISRVEQGVFNMFMVGDVKQSIYRFRLARPEIFMGKFNSYSLEESKTQRIDLTKNFRSREEVLSGTNFVFRQIMRTELGGIGYDDRAALYPGADYPRVSGNETELLLLDLDETREMQEASSNREMPEEPEDRELTDREIEARAVAGRIRELIGSHPVRDKKTGEMRPARYGDIVILLRSLKGWAEPFAAILKEEGIPAFAGTKEGYFETWEVSTLMDYLKILDNFRQDIPLASVLLSPFAGLTAPELAKIRTAFPESPFPVAVRAYAQEHPDTLEGEKLNGFLSQTAHFREMVPYTAIHELISRILSETGYGDYVSAMPGGRQRKANLDMLVNKAVSFESASYKGLFHFVRYIHQLRKYNVDYGEASLMDEQADVVRIMSIHKSKGLEFPIVFVSGMGKQFNTQDIKSMAVMHPDLGIGVDAVDLVYRTKIPVLLKKVIQRELSLENMGEELRVLYVSMTRAKEKLILTGTVRRMRERLAALAPVREQRELPLGFGLLTKAKSYLDWMLPALVRHGSFASVLENYDLTVPFGNPLFKEPVPFTVQVLDQEGFRCQQEERDQDKRILQEWLRLGTELPGGGSKEMREQLENQFTYRYPQAALIGQKRKFTVSELKKMQYPEEELAEAGEILYPAEAGEDVPENVSESTKEAVKISVPAGKLTSAQRGTAYHRAVELLAGRKEREYGEIRALLNQYVKERKISREMAESIWIRDLEQFQKNGLASRMVRAHEEGTLHKEQPFVIGVPVEMLYPQYEGETAERVLVQGIIDAWFQEEDGLVLVDYKTDRVTDEKVLAERYKIQLDYYAQALRQITGKKVKERWIYSFFLGKVIEV